MSQWIFLIDGYEMKTVEQRVADLNINSGTSINQSKSLAVPGASNMINDKQS
jgi:hypothetical protein